VAKEDPILKGQIRVRAEQSPFNCWPPRLGGSWSQTQRRLNPIVQCCPPPVSEHVHKESSSCVPRSEAVK